jgi:5-methyltetrahydropteroyltriglutamate--homocysteine methyltransferase
LRSASIFVAATSRAAGWSRAATTGSRNAYSPAIRAEWLLLEYDDERSGGFEPLAAVPHDKTVILGLVTTKTRRQETIDELQTRIREAARHMPLERLALSSQCGFSTSILGNALTAADEQAKLRTIVATAERVWDNDHLC